MFVTVEHIASKPEVFILRYVRQVPNESELFPKFDAVCIAVKQSAEEVLIKGLAGQISCEVIAACAEQLEQLGFSFAIGYRKGVRFVRYPIAKLKGK